MHCPTMGSCTLKMKSYLSGSNTDTSPIHIYPSNYSSSMYILHKISFCHKTHCSPSQEKSCVVMPTNSILHSDTTVLDHISASMAPSQKNVRKESFSPSPPHWKCEDNNSRHLTYWSSLSTHGIHQLQAVGTSNGYSNYWYNNHGHHATVFLRHAPCVSHLLQLLVHHCHPPTHH